MNLLLDNPNYYSSLYAQSYRFLDASSMFASTIEPMPDVAINDINLPDLAFGIYAWALVLAGSRGFLQWHHVWNLLCNNV